MDGGRQGKRMSMRLENMAKFRKMELRKCSKQECTPQYEPQYRKMTVVVLTVDSDTHSTLVISPSH